MPALLAAAGPYDTVVDPRPALDALLLGLAVAAALVIVGWATVSFWRRRRSQSEHGSR
jgi:uncharacterized membrane protein HdeD (DUF308 family)